MWKSHRGTASALVSCLAALAAACASESDAVDLATTPALGESRSSELLIQRVAQNSTVGDFDGDGLGDAAIGDPTSGRTSACPAGFGAIYIHAGDDPTRGVRWARGAGLSGAAICGAALGTGLDAADIDGDGYEDLIVGVPGTPVGQIQVVFGSAAGLSSTRQATISGPSADGPSAHFGAAIAAGDFDCDGFADVAAAAPDADVGGAQDAGSVTVYRGRASGVATTGTRLVQGAFGDAAEGGDRFGFALAAGNLDADGPGGCGCDDLAISASFEDVSGVEDAGLVHVLFGGSSGPGSGGTQNVPPSGALGPLRGQGLGSHLGIGDIDLDGVDDLSMTLSASDRLAWMSGGAGGLGPISIETDELALGATCDVEAKKGTVTITDIKVNMNPSGCELCCGPGNCCIGGSCGGD
jgi:hypothetical protein